MAKDIIVEPAPSERVSLTIAEALELIAALTSLGDGFRVSTNDTLANGRASRLLHDSPRASSRLHYCGGLLDPGSPR